MSVDGDTLPLKPALQAQPDAALTPAEFSGQSTAVHVEMKKYGAACVAETKP